MIEVVDHLCFIERHTTFGACRRLQYPVRAIAPPALCCQLRRCPEPRGIFRHVPDSAVKGGTPRIPLRPLRLLDQHGRASVELRRQLRVGTRSEDGRGLGVRVDASDLFRRQRETPLALRQLSRIGEKEGEGGSIRRPYAENTEFHAAIDRRKQPLPVFEVDELRKPFAGDKIAEEERCGGIGRDSCRHDDARTPAAFRKTRKHFGEESIGVDVTSAREWVTAR